MSDPFLTDPGSFRIGSMDATRCWVIESRLAELFRVLVAQAERPGPMRKDLLQLAAQVQRLQRKAVAEARRR